MASPNLTDKFEDKIFPEKLESIYKTLNREAFVDIFTENTDEIIWLRPNEIVKSSTPILFLDQPEMTSRIKQGGLANCYLTAAICAIIHANPKWVINKIFTDIDAYPANGKFSILLFHNSQWESVDIDDSIPCDLYGNPIFARCVNKVGDFENEWWLSVLEKAYAKIYGSYANLHGGNMSEALYDLTGLPVLDYSIKASKNTHGQSKQPISTQECDLTCLKEAYLCHDAICVGYCLPSAEIDADTKCRNGILTNHAYALIGLANLKEQSFVRIRNARCDLEFSGKYSRDAQIWKLPAKNTEIVTAFGSAGDELPPGEFWMSYEEFVTYFNRVYICRISLTNLNARRFAGTFQLPHHDIQDFGGCSNYWSWRLNPKFRVCAPNDFIVSVTLTQEDQRGTKSQLNYDQIGITVIRVRATEGLNLEYATGDCLITKTTFVNRRNVSVEFKVPKLCPEENCLIVPSTFYPNVSLKWVFSAHSNHDITLSEYEPTFQSRFLLPGKWSGVTAGGGPKYPSFVNNPSFVIKASEDSTKVDIYVRQILTKATQPLSQAKSPLKLAISQSKQPKTNPAKPKSSPSKPIPGAKKVSSGASAKTSPDQMVGIGFYVLQNFESVFATKPFIGISSEIVYDQTVFTNREEIHKQININNKQSYLLVPCTFQPNIEREFVLEIFSDKPFQIDKFVKSSASLKDSKNLVQSEKKGVKPAEKSSKGVTHGLMEKSHKNVKNLGMDYANI